MHFTRLTLFPNSPEKSRNYIYLYNNQSTTGNDGTISILKINLRASMTKDLFPWKRAGPTAAALPFGAIGSRK